MSLLSGLGQQLLMETLLPWHATIDREMTIQDYTAGIFHLTQIVVTLNIMIGVAINFIQHQRILLMLRMHVRIWGPDWLMSAAKRKIISFQVSLSAQDHNGQKNQCKAKDLSQHQGLSARIWHGQLGCMISLSNILFYIFCRGDPKKYQIKCLVFITEKLQFH